MRKGFKQWVEDKMRTAMSGLYPTLYGAQELPPLAQTPRSANAARAYQTQYKCLLNNLLGAKKKS